MVNNIKDELEIALKNTESARAKIKQQLKKIQEGENADEKQVHLLVSYNLELLDVKLRLKDFIEHLYLIRWD